MREDRRVARSLSTVASGVLALVLLAGCAQQQVREPQPTETADVASQGLPEGFSYVDAVAPSIVIDARYGTADNFTGGIVEGYAASDVAILRDDAAHALADVQSELENAGLGLLVWDAFRPTRAVADFVAWSESPDESTKAEYYPDHEKRELFELGYIALQSRHSLGGTVDLTVIDAETMIPLDMGGPFDFFGELSHYDAAGLTDEQRANRALLRTAMTAQGFEPYPLEWWHFTFPLPDGTEPADFPVS